MSRAAIAFLSGLGSGYLTSQDRQQRQAREDEDRAMRKQEFDLRMGEAERVKKDREALAKAGETAAVNEGAVTLNTGDGAKVYDMPDAAGVAGSDARQFSRNQAATMAPMAASMGTGDVVAPPAAQPAIQSTFAVRGVGYGSKEEAQKAATAYNAPDAVNKRIADAYRATGRPAEALQTEASAKQGKLTDIQLTQAEAAQAHDLAFREITDAFARNGWSSVPKIYENYQDGKTAKVVENGKGGATVNIFDASGKQVGQKAFASEMDFITGAVSKVDPKLWVSMKLQEKKDAQVQANADRTFGLQVNADKRAGAAAAQSARNPGLKKIEEAETILGRKLTQPERERLSGLAKEDDKADSTFATDIVKEAVKGNSVKPEDAPAVRQGLFDQIKGERQLVRIRADLKKAKAAGEMAEAVAKLRANGMSDEAIRGLGGEVPAAAPAPAKEKAPRAPQVVPIAAAQGVPGSGGAAEPAVAANAPTNMAANGTGSALDFVAGLSDDYSSPQAKAALRQRVAQAAGGGTPLSRIEVLRARQSGFIQ